MGPWNSSVSLLPEYFLQASDFGESKVNWRHVEQIITTEEFLIIYADGVPALIVPGRSFLSKEAFEAFSAEAESLRARNAPRK